MEEKKVYTQAELEKAIEESFYPVLMGDGEFEISGNSQVRALDNSQVRAYGNSQVSAWGNSKVSAWDNSQVRAYGNSKVRATKYVAVTIDPQYKGKVAGGVQIKPPPVKTTEEWCDFYGVEVKRGIAILYKAVDDDYSTDNARRVGIFYKPGLSPVAPDWDGGDAECGCGLHFCPSPGHALDFNRSATHFIACPVKVSEIVVHFPAQYQTKVKAPRVYKPCFEVDINGNKI